MISFNISDIDNLPEGHYAATTARCIVDSEQNTGILEKFTKLTYLEIVCMNACSRILVPTTITTLVLHSENDNDDEDYITKYSSIFMGEFANMGMIEYDPEKSEYRVRVWNSLLTIMSITSSLVLHKLNSCTPTLSMVDALHAVEVEESMAHFNIVTVKTNYGSKFNGKCFNLHVDSLFGDECFDTMFLFVTNTDKNNIHKVIKNSPSIQQIISDTLFFGSRQEFMESFQQPDVRIAMEYNQEAC